MLCQVVPRFIPSTMTPWKCLQSIAAKQRLRKACNFSVPPTFVSVMFGWITSSSHSCDCVLVPAKSLYPQEIVYFNKRCHMGPLLSRDLMRSLPDAVRGSVVGPEKHNIMRLCMQHLVSTSLNPKQVLELFSREFYQNKKNRYFEYDVVSEFEFQRVIEAVCALQ